MMHSYYIQVRNNTTGTYVASSKFSHVLQGTLYPSFPKVAEHIAAYCRKHYSVYDANKDSIYRIVMYDRSIVWQGPLKELVSYKPPTIEIVT